jgi:hypothetical protein
MKVHRAGVQSDTDLVCPRRRRFRDIHEPEPIEAPWSSQHHSLHVFLLRIADKHSKTV